MKKTLKKAMASVVAGVTLAVGMTAMSSNAYWTTQSFADGNATAYCSVSSTSVYAYTDSPLTNVTRSVFITNIDYNIEPMRAPYYKTSTSGKVVVQCSASGITTARTEHSLSGYSNKIIIMNP